VGSGRIDEPSGKRGGGKFGRLFCWEWLVVFYFSFMKDDGSGKLDGNGVNWSESVF